MFDNADRLFPVLQYTDVIFFVPLYTWHWIIGAWKDVTVMAREDEIENEQEVAQPTEADATEASVDEEYVEDVVEDVDDGKVSVTVIIHKFFADAYGHLNFIIDALLEK